MLYRCRNHSSSAWCCSDVRSRTLPINDAFASSAELSAGSLVYLLFSEASLAFPAKIPSTNQTHSQSHILRRKPARVAAVDCFDTKKPSPLSEATDLSRWAVMCSRRISVPTRYPSKCHTDSHAVEKPFPTGNGKQDSIPYVMNCEFISRSMNSCSGLGPKSGPMSAKRNDEPSR